MSILLARSVSRKSRRVALLSAASAVAMVVGAAAPQQAKAGEYYWTGAPNIYNLFGDSLWLKMDGTQSRIPGFSTSGDIFHFKTGVTIAYKEGGIAGLITFVSDTAGGKANFLRGSLSGDANAKIRFTGAGNFLLNIGFDGFAGSIDIDATKVALDPTSTTSVDVKGRATLDGTLSAFFKSGSYVSKNYDILTTRDGFTGTFKTVYKPANMTADVDYSDAKKVVLKLTANLTGNKTTQDYQSNVPVNTMRPTGNQLNVARALDSFFNNGGKLPSEYLGIYALSGEGLRQGLAQLSGEVSTGAQTSAFTAANRFMRVASDPLNLARQREAVSSDTFLWGALLGGVERIAGDSSLGAGRHIGRSTGFAVGADHIVDAQTMIGLSVAGASSNWNTRGMGTGTMESFQLAAYGRRSFGGFDVTGSFGFGQHWIGTDRTSFNQHGMSADFTGQTVSARVELGYKLADGWRGFVAFQGQRFGAQGYTEKGGAGDNFILTMGDQSGAQGRVELGARYEDIFRMPDGRQLFLRSQIAWARSHSSTPDVNAGLAALVGSRFTVSGTSAGPDALALATSFDLPLSNALSVGARVDGEWTNNSRGLSGQASVSIRW